MAERHGLLTMVKYKTRSDARRNSISLWRCDCGNEVEILSANVRRGNTKSCGCLVRTDYPTKHGMYCSPTYNSWAQMKRRCGNPRRKGYENYGGRGITVFPAWSESFEAFLAYIGPRPEGTTLDRIDATRGYEPGNVRWASINVQARNRAGTYRWHVRGQTFETCAEAAAHFRSSQHAIRRWAQGVGDLPPAPGCWVEPRYPNARATGEGR